MKNDKISVKWKLFFYIALFAVCMIAVLWLFQTVFLDSFYKSIKTGQIESVAKTLAQNIDNSEFHELVSRMAQNDNICISITDENNNTVYSADILPDCVIHHMPPETLDDFRKEALQNGGTYLEKFKRDNFKNNDYDKDKFRGKAPPKDQGLDESLIYAKIVYNSDGAAYTIILNSTISPVNTTVETLRIQLIYITVVLVVLAFALALFISGKIAKPVIRLNDSAKKLAKGEYGVRFDGRGYRETAQLSETLNTAAFELSRVDTLRRELIANVSHDLRTPLTMITGFAEVMRDLPGESTPENAQIIIDEANRLTRLVTDLLDLSKLQSGAEMIKPSTFNLTQNIRDTVARFSILLEKEKVGVSFASDGDAYITADELQISQVVYNLLANAVAHTNKETKVEVRQAVADGTVRIEIADRGPGIPQEELIYIWERYYKVDKTHTRAHIGSGLGLSIVKGVLERHNAEYGVESAENKGCTFWFSFPVSK